MGKLRYKTLVINRGTKFQEFYGYKVELGWVTAESPIHMMAEDVTWADVKKHFPNEHFNGVGLVTIEINIV